MKKIIAFILTASLMLSSFCLFVQAGEEEVTFSDVKTTRWSYDDISFAVKNGYMAGVGEGRFAPAGTTTRGMVVTVLWRLAGEKSVSYSKKFTDVPDGKWYTTAVLWAANYSIVNGLDARTFGPNVNITREQLAAMMARYASFIHINTEKGNDITKYSDYSKVSPYARESIAWANRFGIINGMDEKTLAPKANATREQFAKILHIFAEKDTAREYEYSLYYSDPVVSSYTEKEYPLVTDADIYVSTKGDDSSDGSFEHPIKTFEKAKEMVRELKKTATEEIKVAFMAGNYGRLEISFTDEDSGTEDVPITYCKYGDGDVMFVNGAVIEEDEFAPLDGSENVSLPAKAKNNIYKIKLADKIDVKDINASSSLFSKTSACCEARYPNKSSNGIDNFIQMLGKIDDRTIKLISGVGKKFESYSKVSEIKLNGYLAYEWGGETDLPVASYNKESCSVTFAKDTRWGIGDGSGSWGNESNFYFSNIPEELDCDGEYYLDRENGYLYVYNPQSTYYFAVYGTFAEVNASYLTFRGFDFYASNARGIILNGHHNTFDLCSMTGGTDMLMRLRGHDQLIENSEFSVMNSLGMYVSGGDHRTMESCRNLITNCSFHDFGLVDRSYAGAIQLAGFEDGGCTGLTVSHCEIYNAPHLAISYGGGMNNIFEYNYIHDVCQYTTDMGAFYSGRSFLYGGCTIRYNVIANIGLANQEPAGVYLDDGLSSQFVYGNLFFNCGNGVRMGGGRDNYICDNIVIETTDKKRDSYQIWNKYYDMVLEGESFSSLPAKPDEFFTTDPLWVEKFPHLASLEYDDIYNLENINAPTTAGYCTVVNNYSIGNNLSNEVGEAVKKFGTVENNLMFKRDENPFFADPTHGDYTITDASYFTNAPIDIKNAGRY